MRLKGAFCFSAYPLKISHPCHRFGLSRTRYTHTLSQQAFISQEPYLIFGPSLWYYTLSPLFVGSYSFSSELHRAVRAGDWHIGYEHLHGRCQVRRRGGVVELFAQMYTCLRGKGLLSMLVTARPKDAVTNRPSIKNLGEFIVASVITTTTFTRP